MNRLVFWTALVLVGLAVALINLFTGWSVRNQWAPVFGLLGLFGVSIALFVAMLITVIGDRRRIVARSSDARWVMARASRGVRWVSLFAVGFCLLLFANCSGNLSSSSSAEVSRPIQDSMRFWTLTAEVLTPLLLALLIPPLLTSAAERLAGGRPHAARRLGQLAIWSMAAIVAAVLLTVAGGFILGVSYCDFGTSAGYCGAGASSIMNLLSVGALALFLPYLLLVTWALGQMEARGWEPQGGS